MKIVSKMKKIVFLCLLWGGITTMFAGQDSLKTKLYNDRDESIEELNGKIKSLTETRYEVDKRDGVKPENDTAIYFFDALGLNAKRQGLDEDCCIEYDSQGRMKKLKSYSKDTVKLKYILDYFYKNGNLVQVIWVNRNLPQMKSNFYYYKHITLYKYDSRNLLIVKERRAIKDMTRKPEVLEVIKYRYDEAGNNVFEKRKLKCAGKEERHKKYTDNKLIQEVYKSYDGRTKTYSKNIYAYDAGDSLVSQIEICNVSPKRDAGKYCPYRITTYHRKYDEQNRLIEFKTIEKSLCVYEFVIFQSTVTYTNFDSKGNWQEKKIENNYKSLLYTRRFEYYEE